MRSRLELHEELCTLLGSRNVYFQPPESVKLQYPCIIYHFSSPAVRHADNKLYMYYPQYELTLITRDPDTVIRDEIVYHFPLCSIDRFFTNDNLNHYTYTLYF